MAAKASPSTVNPSAAAATGRGKMSTASNAADQQVGRTQQAQVLVLAQHAAEEVAEQPLHALLLQPQHIERQRPERQHQEQQRPLGAPARPRQDLEEQVERQDEEAQMDGLAPQLGEERRRAQRGERIGREAWGPVASRDRN